MFVLNTILPIALIVLIGNMIVRFGFLPKEFFKNSNKLVFWIGLPSLLFIKTARPIDQIDVAMKLLMVLSGGMIVCIVVAYVFAFFAGLPSPTKSSVVQGAYRGNLAYIGLPVVLYAYTDAYLTADAYETLAILAIMPLVPIYNIVAVLVLLSGQTKKPLSNSEKIKMIVYKTITNPLIIACLLGILYSITELPLPSLLKRTGSAIGQTALPLALLGIGATINLKSLKNDWLSAFTASLIKIVLAPFAGWLIACHMNLNPAEMRIALLFLACPTAAASFVMAEQLGCNKNIAAQIVVTSTIFSVIPFTIILILTSM